MYIKYRVYFRRGISPGWRTAGLSHPTLSNTAAGVPAAQAIPRLVPIPCGTTYNTEVLCGISTYVLVDGLFFVWVACRTDVFGGVWDPELQYVRAIDNRRDRAKMRPPLYTPATGEVGIDRIRT